MTSHRIVLASALTDADKARITAAVALTDTLRHGDRITLTVDGRTIVGAYDGRVWLRRGRDVVGAEVIVRVGTGRTAYPLQDVHDLARAEALTEACGSFRPDPATEGRRVRRCASCGLSERMH